MKKLLIAMAAMAAMAMPARADEAELLARIEALEQRVTQLETLISGSEEVIEGETDAANQQASVITLGSGNWIVGEDIPAGVYNLTSDSYLGGYLWIYKDISERVNGGFALEFYTVPGQASVEEYKEDLDGNDYSSMDDTVYTTISNIYILGEQCLKIDGSVTFTSVE